MSEITLENVIEKLRQVMDPHTGGNLYDMGLIQDMTLEDGKLSLRLVLTSNFCPIGMQLGMGLKRKLRELPLVDIDVKIDNYNRSDELEKLLTGM